MIQMEKTVFHNQVFAVQRLCGGPLDWFNTKKSKVLVSVFLIKNPCDALGVQALQTTWTFTTN